MQNKTSVHPSVEAGVHPYNNFTMEKAPNIIPDADHVLEDQFQQLERELVEFQDGLSETT